MEIKKEPQTRICKLCEKEMDLPFPVCNECYEMCEIEAENGPIRSVSVVITNRIATKEKYKNPYKKEE